MKFFELLLFSIVAIVFFALLGLGAGYIWLWLGGIKTIFGMTAPKFFAFSFGLLGGYRAM